MPSFQCIGDGSVPSPMTCRMVGQAMHRKASRLALEEAPILFFVSYRDGKMLKPMSVFLKCAVFIALAVALYRPHQIAGR